MYVLMITGGIGSGKSEAREYFHLRGAVVLDLDEIAHGAVEPGSDILSALVREFGDGIIDDRGELISSQLAAEAFVSKESTARMNAIMFPHILEQASEYIINVHCYPVTDAPLLVVEVPLLTEVPEFAHLADEVMAISADTEVRVRRLTARGMFEDDVRMRIALQASDEERELMADTVIDNSGSREAFVEKLEEWWNERESVGWEK